ncbi:MAG TPA: hypothetical protein VN200_00555 [Rhodoglobus sp.]|nr:hypothetical protein [Rhodoglobus sp.]
MLRWRGGGNEAGLGIVVHINRDQFILATSEAADRLRERIAAALRAGGAFVAMGDHPRAPEVLITPSTPVRIEHAPDIAALAEVDDGAEFVDFDTYRLP